MELKDAIQNRKSEREFSDKPLTKKQVSCLLWAAYKVPSAGGLYPLTLYYIVDWGAYKLNNEGLGEVAIPFLIVICANFQKTIDKYGERGRDYVFMEAGHTAQNISLMAVELGLACYCIGAFDRKSVKEQLKTDLEPIYMVALGNKK